MLHVSSGRELALKPGINIIGILQPLGPSVDMSDMPDMLAVGEPMSEAGESDIGIVIAVCSDLLRMLMDGSIDIELIDIVDADIVSIGILLFEVSELDIDDIL